MASSLFQNNQTTQLNQSVINQAKQIMSNANSPQIKMITSFLSGKGLSPEQAVRNICANKGINVDEFMSQLR